MVQADLYLKKLKKINFGPMARLSQKSQDFPFAPQNKSIKDNF